MTNNNETDSIFLTETPDGPIDKEEFKNAYNPLIQQVDSFIGSFSSKSKEQAISYGKRLIQAVLKKNTGEIHLCEFESTRSIGPHGIVAKNCVDGKWYCSGDHTRRAKERLDKKLEEEKKRKFEEETRMENEKLRKVNDDLAKRILIWERVKSTEDESPLKKKRKTTTFEEGTKEKPITELEQEIANLDKEPDSETDAPNADTENAFEEVSNANSSVPKQKRKYTKRQKNAESGEPPATEPSN